MVRRVRRRWRRGRCESTAGDDRRDRREEPRPRSASGRGRAPCSRELVREIAARTAGGDRPRRADAGARPPVAGARCSTHVRARRPGARRDARVAAVATTSVLARAIDRRAGRAGARRHARADRHARCARRRSSCVGAGDERARRRQPRTRALRRRARQRRRDRARRRGARPDLASSPRRRHPPHAAVSRHRRHARAGVRVEMLRVA